MFLICSIAVRASEREQVNPLSLSFLLHSVHLNPAAENSIDSLFFRILCPNFLETGLQTLSSRQLALSSNNSVRFDPSRIQVFWLQFVRRRCPDCCCNSFCHHFLALIELFLTSYILSSNFPSRNIYPCRWPFKLFVTAMNSRAGATVVWSSSLVLHWGLMVLFYTPGSSAN